MALKPAIGKKYAKLREEQERLLSNEESKMASATSSQRLELLAAAATANAWQVTRPTFLDESRPELPSQECLQMESILLQAMELQQKHLVSIRQRLPNAGDGEGEEVNAQTSLEHIQRTLEATQLAMVHWGHRAMLPATAPQVLQYLNTRDTFAFRTVNPAVCRACQDGDLLLMPCLDMVPEHRDDMPLFFTQLSLGSTKVMWMNSVGTLQVLETRFSLPTLETLLLPKGLGILLSDLQVPSLPCLRRLYVRAGIDTESEFNWPKAVHSSKGALPDSLTLPGVHWIRELISKTSQRLCLIDVEELDSRLAQPFLQVVSGPTRPKRLVLRRCVLPDAAIQDLCTFLEEPSRAQFVVHFDNCELSIFSEQLLAQALEQFERFCAFSIDGGKVSEKPIEVSEWCQATPRFVQERSCTERNAQFVAAEVAAKGIPSPITESDSNEEDEDAVAVSAPPPRQVDHINQLSTAELLAHVLRRLEEDRLNPTSQASAIESFRAQLAGQAASASGAASSGDFLVPMQPESSLMGLGDPDFDDMD